jgi:DNA ligase 4
MLCQRINFKLIDTLITEQSHYLETKMDGERFQLHMKDEEYRYFSRNSFDYTHIFGSDFKSGTLTPLLPPLFLKKVNSIILDGEMMVWNMTDKIYHTKSENYDAKSLKTGSNLRAEFCVYDILYFNDKTLIGLPYGERVRLLGTLFEDHSGILTKSKRTKITDNAQFQECLNAAIDAKEEGVVLKAEDSTYKAGERNAGWYKIKPDVSGLEQ